jgi:hypothetical protein
MVRSFRRLALSGAHRHCYLERLYRARMATRPPIVASMEWNPWPRRPYRRPTAGHPPGDPQSANCRGARIHHEGRAPNPPCGLTPRITVPLSGTSPF